MNDVELYRAFQQSPILFIEKMWGLVPQIEGEPFIRGKHITFQQVQILEAVENAIAGAKSKRISVASGHGVGKSATISWLLLWYLFCFKDAQVACTAPSSEQMHDVLWKEAAKWIKKMPEPIQAKYEWTGTHIRITESPETWFARAKTARKESPEALAGVHADHVMLLVDEASGVAEEIFNTAEGALTDKNTITILISNPTRLIGYFYATQHQLKHKWQTLQFSSLDSPLVDEQYNQNIIDLHGEDSDEYRIRVLGEFPNEESADERGYLPLLSRGDVTFIDQPYEFRKSESGRKRLGLDPAGEGRDKTVWVIRDRFVMQKLAEEKISTPKEVARRTIDIINYYGIDPRDVWVDGFGIGAKVAFEIGILPEAPRINVVLTSEKANNEDAYLNVRAESAFRLRKWVNDGGQIKKDRVWEELFLMRYRRNLSGKIQLMDKVTMKKLLNKSPDYFDAASLTFVRPEESTGRFKQTRPHWDGYGKIKSNNTTLGGSMYR